MTTRSTEDLDDRRYRQRCNEAVAAFLRFATESFPELLAADAAGCLVIAGAQVAQRAGLDHQVACTLRALADQLDGHGVPLDG